MTLPPYADPPIREAAIRNARDTLALGPLIVDTETTGLGDDAEIVEIAVVDSQGSIVFDSLVKPSRPIPREASDIHGITNAAVAVAPGFAQLWAAELKGVLRTAPHVAIYNADYDVRLITQSLGRRQRQRGSRSWAGVTCITDLYAQFWGEWHDYSQSYTWQKLEAAAYQCGLDWEGGAHRALADAKISLKVLKFMVAFRQ